MGGQPVVRASSAAGRWAYTLYARRGDELFVHALDTVKREAFCVDLLLQLGYGRQWGLTLARGCGCPLRAPRSSPGRRCRHEHLAGERLSLDGRGRGRGLGRVRDLAGYLDDVAVCIEDARCRSALEPRERISRMPVSSRSQPSLGRARRRVRGGSSVPPGRGSRRPVARSICGASRPCRAASHLFSVVRIRWYDGILLAALVELAVCLTSAWQKAAMAIESSTRVTASQIRISIVQARWGRMSHQMCV